MSSDPEGEPSAHHPGIVRVGPGPAAWIAAGCWVIFLLVGAAYFIYGSDLFGYLVGIFCIGSAIYFIRRELRWVSAGHRQLVVRGLLYRRTFALDDEATWSTSPVSSGLPRHTIEVRRRGLIVRLESLRYSTEAKAAAVAERLFPEVSRSE